MPRSSRSFTFLAVPVVAVALGLPAQAAWAAAAWHADRVSGHASVSSADGQQTELVAGMDLVPGATLSTGERSRVMLVRGTETMVVGPKSVIAVSEHPTEGLTTTVLEKAGTVQFDVEKRNVRYFSVETPMLAAVVKGTRFTVSVGRARGGVAVSRGTVQVSALATGQVSDVTAGQHARVTGHGLSVGGAGRRSISIGTPRAAVVSALAADMPSVEAAPRFARSALATGADHTSNAAFSEAVAVPATPAVAAPVAAPTLAPRAAPPAKTDNLGGGLLSAVAGTLSSPPSPPSVGKALPSVSVGVIGGPKSPPAPTTVASQGPDAGVHVGVAVHVNGWWGHWYGYPGPKSGPDDGHRGVESGKSEASTSATSTSATSNAATGGLGSGSSGGSQPAGSAPAGPAGNGGSHGPSGRGFGGFGRGRS